MLADLLLLLLVIAGGLMGLVWLAIRQRHMQLWLPSYLWPCPSDLAARREVARRVRLALELPRTGEDAAIPTELASVETGLCTTSVRHSCATFVVQKPKNHRGKGTVGLVV